jgi:glycerol-1-phosphatase
MLASRFDAFLFDLDGVLYRGAVAVDGAVEAMARLRALGGRVAFVTNNSSRTPEAVAAKLRGLGIPADASEVETSALTTATMLAERGVATAFVVGEEGITRALRDRGVTVVEGEPAVVDVVVVGLDRQADYAELRTASILVESGVPLVATNADASFPAADGRAWPGAGALLAAIEVTTGARAEVVGKPNPPIMRAALARAGGGTPLVIGDRIDTDIAGAHAIGWDSLLVLTGITRREDVAASDVQPTFVGEDLGALFETPSA